MNNVMRIIGKFFFPVIFFLIGLERIIAGLTTKTVEDSEGNVYTIDQNMYFVFAGVLCFLISAIIFLFVLGKLNRKAVMIIGAISIPISIIVIYLNITSIVNEVQSREFKAEVQIEMAQRIIDLKDAQLAYKTVNGVFTDDIDKLVDFVKNGKVAKPISAGNVPERTITVWERDSLYPKENRPIDHNMSEIEAWRLSKMAFVSDDLKGFKRDTVYVSVLEKYFSGPKYEEKRKRSGSKTAFNVDSMAYIPHTKAPLKFGIATGEVLKNTGTAPTLLIWAVHPMDSLEMDSIFLGNLTKVDFNGSWQ